MRMPRLVDANSLRIWSMRFSRSACVMEDGTVGGFRVAWIVITIGFEKSRESRADALRWAEALGLRRSASSERPAESGIY